MLGKSYWILVSCDEQEPTKRKCHVSNLTDTRELAVQMVRDLVPDYRTDDWETGEIDRTPFQGTYEEAYQEIARLTDYSVMVRVEEVQVYTPD